MVASKATGGRFNVRRSPKPRIPLSAVVAGNPQGIYAVPHHERIENPGAVASTVIGEPLSREPSKTWISIREISSNLHLIRPLTIKIDWDNENKEYIAYCEIFELFGVGKSVNKAVEDLKLLLEEDYANLASEKLEDLDNSAIQSLNFYQAFLGSPLYCLRD